MFLQFLNGSRDQQVEELNPAASLVIGSGDDAHIRVPEPGVEGKHCQVYPAQGAFWLQDLGAGNTILHMKRLKGTTEGLKGGDIFIIGQTFVKFWTERPVQGAAAPAAPSSSGGGAALEAAKKELAAATAQATRLEGELAAARKEAEAAGEELSRAQGDVQVERAGREEAEQKLEALAQEKASVEQRVKELEGEVERARADAEQARADVEQARADAEAQASKAKEEAEAQVAAARSDAEAELARGREALEREQAEGKAALEATRAELEALRLEKEVAGRDRLAALTAGAGDLAAWVASLGLDHAARVRLEAALEDAITREALARAAGPVVPLRGLRVPGCDRDLEAELGAARRAAEHVAAARSLRLHDLDTSELDRLLEAARA